jgi:hypothetical protein
MYYVVYVIAAFETDSSVKSFDIWEFTFRLKSDDITDALEGALARAREILDNDDNRRALGYPRKPTLYAVTNIDEDIDLPRGMPNERNECMLLTKIVTLDESGMELIRSYREVPVPIRIFYVGRTSPACPQKPDSNVSVPRMSDQRVDQLILSFARSDGRKVVMIIACVMEAAEKEGFEIRAPQIVSRVDALLAQNKLLPKDPTSKGRFSEVKLP